MRSPTPSVLGSAVVFFAMPKFPLKQVQLSYDFMANRLSAGPLGMAAAL